MTTETMNLTKKQLEDEILKLKKELNAVILAHYYQESEIQDVADFIGDSLELAKKAKTTTADVIVFCGVHFMAETAKILNPEKTVVIPDMQAGCSLSDSCPPDKFAEFRRQHPDHLAITYINCSAEVKALSDIICTSSNAEKLIRQIPESQPILFSPDKNLGRYIAKTTGRDMLIWDGACIVHEAFSEEKILKLKLQHPEAKLIAHPECEEVLLQHADYIGSTSRLLQYVKDDTSSAYIVATEPGIIHQMQKSQPNKTFIAAPAQDDSCACNNCPHMKLNTMEKLYLCMKNLSPQIEMSDDLRLRALAPLEKMLQMS
ncbi:MAG: quinolinate synthase NadA [Ignavibacteriaceae bacterium]|nr:quinolinate synthase NadA [Ignavibacteriaceae bacterium]